MLHSQSSIDPLKFLSLLIIFVDFVIFIVSGTASQNKSIYRGLASTPLVTARLRYGVLRQSWGLNHIGTESIIRKPTTVSCRAFSL